MKLIEKTTGPLQPCSGNKLSQVVADTLKTWNDWPTGEQRVEEHLIQAICHDKTEHGEDLVFVGNVWIRIYFILIDGQKAPSSQRPTVRGELYDLKRSGPALTLRLEDMELVSARQEKFGEIHLVVRDATGQATLITYIHDW